MTEYTGVHKFWVQRKYSEKFRQFFADKFDTSEDNYWLYNHSWCTELRQNERYVALYIETVNNDIILKEIEKLKQYKNLAGYEQSEDKTRLYHLPFGEKKLQAIIPSEQRVRGEGTYYCKYLNYAAKVKLIGMGLETEINLLDFVSEGFVPTEEEKIADILDKYPTANAYVCIKAICSTRYYGRIFSCSLHSITMK